MSRIRSCLKIFYSFFLPFQFGVVYSLASLVQLSFLCFFQDFHVCVCYRYEESRNSDNQTLMFFCFIILLVIVLVKVTLRWRQFSNGIGPVRTRPFSSFENFNFSWKMDRRVVNI